MKGLQISSYYCGQCFTKLCSILDQPNSSGGQNVNR